MTKKIVRVVPNIFEQRPYTISLEAFLQYAQLGERDRQRLERLEVGQVAILRQAQVIRRKDTIPDDHCAG
jgi:hypothetical protein